MESRGVVTGCRDHVCRVLLLADGCDASSCAGCGMCAGHGKANGRELSVPGDWPVGTSLRLSIEQPNPGLAAAVLFGLPLIGLFVGGAVGGMAAPQAAWSLILGGASGVVAGGLLAAGLARFCPSLQTRVTDIKAVVG